LEIFVIKEIIFWFCIVVGMGAFLFMPMSVIHHYVRVQRPSEGFSLGLVKELFWLVIPCLMILLMVLPAGEEMVSKHLQGSVFFFNESFEELAAFFGEADSIIVGFNEGLAVYLYR